MIRSNFQIFDGIGRRTEQILQQNNIKKWSDVFHQAKPDEISTRKWNNLQKSISLVDKAIASKNITKIKQFIPSEYRWQLIPQFIGKIAYLDIETTGLSARHHYITTIAVYDGNEVQEFVRHQNLTDFPKFIAQYPAIATFYGKGFDIPFITEEMNIHMPHLHFDLCFILRKLGLKGGLKKIEEMLGIHRQDTKGVDGAAAVRLWRKYRETNDIKYLDTLLAYNIDDVLNLEDLLYYAYNELLELAPITGNTQKIILQKSEIPIKYKADKSVISEITHFQ